MTLYYYEEMTMREIGLALGVVESRDLAGSRLGGGASAGGAEGSGCRRRICRPKTREHEVRRR